MDLTLELAPIAEVRGVVRDETEQPIESAVVELWAKDGEDSTRVSSGWTDAQGRYRVGPAKPGVLKIFVGGEELFRVVVDARGQPVEGVRVEVRSALSRGRVPWLLGGGWVQQTGPDGRFSLQSVSGAQLELRVEKPEYVLACSEREGGRIALPVKPGDREVRAVLVREAFVHWQILHWDGTPVPSFPVSTREGLGNAREFSNEEGLFSVPILCTGTLQLELRVAEGVDVRGGSRRLRRLMSVREEVDVHLGALVLDGG
ncbi:carboxypeptidase-like regulatory domain-containing protein [Cystobacter ferrugineus]|uniref:Carboxypeptidase regulatory-like domain-containing protein n=1 Tax=Cystobacter ferrugineus TaxID=83449 RepID=A0A1L9BB80_9BACT|nr:carboxypeptidase-like regulatory domain-containing protein [Cystobacter ferrugineus]OJH39478.1 hypothetical protein BON30_18450 [Cystobacter ferrugineus]